MKLSVLITSCILYLFSIASWAVDDDCGNQSMEIIDLKVIATYDSAGIPFNNMLLLQFDKLCRGTSYMYVEESNPMFNGLLSIALSAYTTNSAVYPAVVSSGTKTAGAITAEKLLWLRQKR